MSDSPTPITEDAGIPVAAPTPILSYRPLTFRVSGRAADLQLRVSLPATGSKLPVILFSHGHGPSMFGSSYHAYGPLVEFWAARGFVVIQPMHLDANVLGRRQIGDPDEPLYAKSRVQDMHCILDHLDDIEATTPTLAGRLDHSRVAAIGHSLGGHTVNMLLGQHMTDLQTGDVLDMSDKRVTVGVPLAAPGAGADMDGQARQAYPAITSTTFENMSTPALVVVGEHDHHPFFSSRPDWRSDCYTLSPGPKTKLTLLGAEHMLGGVSGWDSAETTDESPQRVAALRALIWAYLRSTLYPEDTAWADATAALAGLSIPLATIESKGP